ncbi:phage tail protein [Xenorhabdus bovienii]|uniref:phage tail protein n=2 Tax=Xenorhabdus bovienii TaxID=40576 RepID=UPI0023B23900|nr:phage tail protein [Xenorhabdus bovienii]MDE9459349.1 phage tail protein [Xenorhabdus bovienii]
MSTKYFALLTRLGADKLANAAALGTKLEITQMAVGDGGGSLPTPHTTQAQLINERRRAAINVLSIDPKNTNQIIAEQVIPESEGGWWIREIGLFDKDGILIAVGNCAETYKPQLQEGSGRTQTLRMVLIVSSTDAVTLKIDPAVVLATREYVDSRVTNSIKDHENSRRHPDATLKDKGFVILSSATDSHSETQAATPKAVKVAYDLANVARDNANGRVPATRKVNGKALSSDISLGAGDVGAYTTGEVDSCVNEAKSLANTAIQNAANANTNANSRLEKKQNGADIPNKPKFVENLGLAETVNLAKNAIPKSSIEQWTGTSSTTVMSQKSVTDALSGKFDKTGGSIDGEIIASQVIKSTGRIAVANPNGFSGLDLIGEKHDVIFETNGKEQPYIAIRDKISGGVSLVTIPKKSGTMSLLSDVNEKGSKNTARNTPNGWWKCGDTGRLIQQGFVIRTGRKTQVFFPTEFPDNCYGVSVSLTNDVAELTSSATNIRATNVSSTGFTYESADWPEHTASWIAIGY